MLFSNWPDFDQKKLIWLKIHFWPYSDFLGVSPVLHFGGLNLYFDLFCVKTVRSLETHDTTSFYTFCNYFFPSFVLTSLNESCLTNHCINLYYYYILFFFIFSISCVNLANKLTFRTQQASIYNASQFHVTYGYRTFLNFVCTMI